MKPVLLTCGFLLAFLFGGAVVSQGQSSFTGTWTTTAFGQPNLIDLQAEGRSVTGTISRNQQVVSIHDGRTEGNTVSFKVTFAGGNRINTYTGTLNGDEISFSRAVQVRRADAETGEGIFGAGGPMKFVAKREPSSSLTPRVLLGNWRVNPQRSTYKPGPAPTSSVPETRNYVSRSGGGLGMLAITAGAEGGPNFTLAFLRGDGKEFPVHTATSLVSLLDSSTPTALTMSLRTMDARTFEITSKNNGVVTATRRVMVFPDGNTLVERVTTVDAKGQPTATNTVVFDRIVPAVPVDAGVE